MDYNKQALNEGEMKELVRAIDKLSEVREIELNGGPLLTTQDVKVICQLLSIKKLYKFGLSLAANMILNVEGFESLFKSVAA